MLAPQASSLLPDPMTFKVQFRLRIYRDEGIAIGPGKVALVGAIAETGSISAAARRLGRSYRRAWLLIDELNRSLRKPASSIARTLRSCTTK